MQTKTIESNIKNWSMVRPLNKKECRALNVLHNGLMWKVKCNDCQFTKNIDLRELEKTTLVCKCANRKKTSIERDNDENWTYLRQVSSVELQKMSLPTDEARYLYECKHCDDITICTKKEYETLMQKCDTCNHVVKAIINQAI